MQTNAMWDKCASPLSLLPSQSQRQRERRHPFVVVVPHFSRQSKCVAVDRPFVSGKVIAATPTLSPSCLGYMCAASRRKGASTYDVCSGRGRGVPYPKSRCRKGGCVNLVLWIRPKFRQWGSKIPKILQTSYVHAPLPGFRVKEELSCE